jgi:hypothetical protein
MSAVASVILNAIALALESFVVDVRAFKKPEAEP